MDTIHKLNQYNNFHLSLKAIQVSDTNLLVLLKETLIKNKKTVLIITGDNAFDLLKEAYDNNIDYVLIDDSINYLLPLLCIITSDNVNIIKPLIPVYYYLKDNRIIQKIKTTCNKKYTSYTSYKNIEELLEGVIKTI